MWKVTIQCSADSWSKQGAVFKEIAAEYSNTPQSSKKMKGDGRRVMEYELENVGEVEEFLERSLALDGFMGEFEAL